MNEKDKIKQRISELLAARENHDRVVRELREAQNRANKAKADAESAKKEAERVVKNTMGSKKAVIAVGDQVFHFAEEGGKYIIIAEYTAVKL